VVGEREGERRGAVVTEHGAHVDGSRALGVAGVAGVASAQEGEGEPGEGCEGERGDEPEPPRSGAPGFDGDVCHGSRRGW
jgi:hypothetical protein